MVQLNQFDSKNFKKNWSTYIILGLSLGAMLFFGVCNPQGFMHQLDNVAGSVDGEEVTQIEFSRAYQGEVERTRQRMGESAQEVKVAGQVLDQLLTYRILFLEAKQLGLGATDDEVVSYLTQIRAFRDKDGKFSDEAFQNFLRGNRYSEVSFMDEMRRNITVDHLRDLIANANYVSTSSVDFDYRLGESKMKVDFLKVDPDKVALTITDAEIQAFLANADSAAKIKTFYDAHQSEYHTPEKVHARHILVAYKDARNAAGDAAKRSKEDAKKRAETLLAHVKASGADFAAIAKKETDEPTGKNSGGDLGFFSADAMVKEFSDAAFAMKAGQLSSVVESPFGFHIIQLLERKPEHNVSLEQARLEIARKLLRQTQGPALAKELSAKILAALKDNKSVDELLKSAGASWKTSEDFAFNTTYISGIGSNAKMVESVLKLRQPGQLVQDVVEVQSSSYIIRLNSRTVADPNALDAKKREQIMQTSVYRNGFLFLQKFEQTARDKFEKRKAVYRNPQYLALDNAKED